MTQYWILHFFCLLDIFPLNPGDFLFVFPANFCFSKQVICQIACLFRRGVGSEIRQGLQARVIFRSIITAAVYRQQSLGGRWHRIERHGVFFIVKWGRICKIKNQMGSKSSKGCFVLAFFLRMIVVFFFVLIFTVRFSLSHFGWIFHAKLAHSSSSSSFFK